MSVAVKRQSIKDKLPETWLGLQAELRSLRPIHSKKDHNEAISIAGLLASQNTLNRDQQDYLESLTLVIAAYEQKHFKIETGKVTAVEVIESLLEDNGMNASDLGRLLGDRSLGTRILKGQRELSKSHIHILCERFKVSPAVFFDAN
ncbi:MAG: hypothetical protein PHF37_08210 [Phycisphaerae bacterium]|nr:hypothetical protein [Phycisphaerae bacterium]